MGARTLAPGSMRRPEPMETGCFSISIVVVDLLHCFCFANTFVAVFGINCGMLQDIGTRCIASWVLSLNPLKSVIVALGYFPSWRFWGPINSGFAYAWEVRGAARSAAEGWIVQVAALFFGL